MNVILCGLPMSGKSTLGEMVAKQLKQPFIDTDRLIEHAYRLQTSKQRSCRQICLLEGEAVFRQLEREQIASLKEVSHSLIAVGGGSLSDPENLRSLQSLGQLIYLKAPIKAIWERICLREIPAYLNSDHPEKAFYALAEKRISLYESVANAIIDTQSLNEHEVMRVLLNLLKGEK